MSIDRQYGFVVVECDDCGDQQAIDRLIDLQLERHAWLSPAAEQVRKWRAEDEANGIFWHSTRDGSESNKPLPTNE